MANNKNLKGQYSIAIKRTKLRACNQCRSEEFTDEEVRCARCREKWV